MTQTTIDQELLELEQRLWQAIKERNVAEAAGLTADPCIVAGASGVAKVDRATFIGMMEGAQYTLHDFSISDPEICMVSDDVATLAYNVREDLTVDGHPVTLNAADSSVWVRRDGSWSCALHTESVLGDSYGRDRVPARSEE
jgi:hypothetical protein